MKELNQMEVDAVSGALSMKSIGNVFGFLYGAGAKTQKRVDSYDNFMLSAMQYGA